MKTLKFIVILIVVLGGSLFAGIFLYNKSIGPEGWAKNNTEKMLSSVMKNPESMVIRSYFFVKKPTSTSSYNLYMCGVVDGLNSFGAYSGGTRFASSSYYMDSSSGSAFDTTNLQIADKMEIDDARSVGMLSSFEKVYWNEWCVDSQHPPLSVGDSGLK
ncbi:hypothetical protein [Shewanella decolorationis]|uniref:hypothetical protein n=1 Tax=Shewanella decolorationis TaxID=256839 RepID=UPI0010571AB5|nr:hypothetical protein [Shewanella decolorationis]